MGTRKSFQTTFSISRKSFGGRGHARVPLHRSFTVALFAVVRSHRRPDRFNAGMGNLVWFALC
jgi:hypothetical protein